MDAVAVARVETRVIVIVKDQQRLIVVDLGLGFVDPLAEFRDIQLVDHAHLEVHGQLQFVVLEAIAAAQVGDVAEIGLADQNPAGKLVDDRTQLLFNVVDLGQVLGHAVG